MYGKMLLTLIVWLPCQIELKRWHERQVKYIWILEEHFGFNWIEVVNVSDGQIKRTMIFIGKGKHVISIENFQFTSKFVEDKQQSKF